jgi:hypothetical protein
VGWERPVERHALGLVMRRAERVGICAPPSALRGFVAKLPYSAEEIDRGLELLVSSEGRTLGGTLEISALPEGWIAELVDEGLVDLEPAGPRLTAKGRDFTRLLGEYASPRHLWRSRRHREQGDHSSCQSRLACGAIWH